MSKSDRNEIIDAEFSALKNYPLPIDYIDSDIVLVEAFDAIPSLGSVKLKYNIFAYCKGGYVELDVADRHYVVNEGEVFIVPSGMIIDNLVKHPDAQFSILCLTDRIIQSLLSTNIDIWNRAVYFRKEHLGSLSNPK